MKGPDTKRSDRICAANARHQAKSIERTRKPLQRAKVLAWAERHDLKGTFTEILSAFEDARTLE